jgi:hypothetical protein
MSLMDGVSGLFKYRIYSQAYYNISNNVHPNIGMFNDKTSKGLHNLLPPSGEGKYGWVNVTLVNINFKSKSICTYKSWYSIWLEVILQSSFLFLLFFIILYHSTIYAISSLNLLQLNDERGKFCQEKIGGTYPVDSTHFRPCV